MSDVNPTTVNLPAYAKIPNGPHEPNLTKPGVAIVEMSFKMAKTLMKMAKPKVQVKGTNRSMPSPTRSMPKKKPSVKWY